MKKKITVISLYILLVLLVCVSGVYWSCTFVFDDVLNYYYGGILKLVFILIMVAGIVLPIIKYRKHPQKWVLPAVLCLIVLLTPIFNNGILGFVKEDLSDFSRKKWEQHKALRIYMLNDLELHHLYKGQKEEKVKDLLGEPSFVSGENTQRYEYGVSPGFIDPVMFYVQFENGVLVEIGKYSS